MPREVIEQALYDEIEAQIAAIEQQGELVDIDNYLRREQARRMIDEEIVARLERLIDRADKGQKKKLRAVKRHATAVKSMLLQVHEQLWARTREGIRQGAFPAVELLPLLQGYVEPRRREKWSDPPRYDALDTFVDGLLQIDEMPRTREQPDPEMVLYQPTPARIVLDLLQRSQPGPHDVVYDLGSGLGRVPLLVGLVCDAITIGVEYEPAYVEYARRRAQMLNLPRVQFLHADARDVNYADGTVFYLYTPFKGKILQRVMELLRYEARSRQIRVCTYGPGSLDVAPQEWLVSADGRPPNVNQPWIFVSQ